MSLLSGARTGTAAAVVAALALVVPVLHAEPAPAQTPGLTFQVNDVRQLVDANVGNGVCATAVGTCTLRAAVQEANATPTTQDTIVPAADVNATASGTQSTGTIALDDNTGTVPTTTCMTVTAVSAYDPGAWYDLTTPVVIDLQARLSLISSNDFPFCAVFHVNGPDIAVRNITRVRGAETGIVFGGLADRVVIDAVNMTDAGTANAFFMERALVFRNGAKNVTVQRLTVDDMWEIGVVVEAGATVSNVTLDRLTFRENTTDGDDYLGIWALGGSVVNGFTLSNSTFTGFNVFQPLYLDGRVNSMVVDSNSFSGTARPHVWSSIGGTNRRISNNTFTAGSTGPSTAIIIIPSDLVDDLDIVDNTFAGFNFGDNTIELWRADQVTIRRNLFRNVFEAVPPQNNPIIDLFEIANEDIPTPLLTLVSANACSLTGTVAPGTLSPYFLGSPSAYVRKPPYTIDWYWTASTTSPDAELYLGETTLATNTPTAFTVPFTAGAGAIRVQLTDNVGNSSELSAIQTVTPTGTCAPKVTVEQAPPPDQPDPTSVRTITFFARFTEAITTSSIAQSDFSVAGSTAPGARVTGITATVPGLVYEVRAQADASGTVVVSLPAGAVTDAGGNGNEASTSVDNSVSYVSPLTITPTVSVVEGGPAQSIVLSTTLAATAQVNVALGGRVTTQFTVATPIRLATNQTSVAQPVAAVDDALIEGDQTYPLTTTVTSTDANFTGLVLGGVRLTVVDNDYVNDDTLVATQGLAAELNVLDNDAVPGRVPGGPLPPGFSWTLVDGPFGGSLRCTAAGACTYTPLGSFAGADRFRYSLTGPGGPDLGLVTITVAVVNDPPEARTDRAVTTTGVAVLVPVLANDTDPNDPFVATDPNRFGDPRTVAGVTLAPSNGSAVCSPVDCTYTPAAGFVGRDRFEVRIVDSRGASAVGAVEVWVDPSPLAPVRFVGADTATRAAASSTFTATTSVTAVGVCTSGQPAVNLSWAPTAAATGYVVERADPVTAGRWTVVTLTPSTSFADTFLGTAASLSYRVTPLRGRWIGTTSGLVPVTTPNAVSFAGC